MGIKHTLYVDGSYRKGEVFWGFALTESENNGPERIIEAQFGQSSEGVEYQNCTAELTATLRAMEHATTRGIRSVSLVYDFEGVEKFVTKKSKATNKFTLHYAQKMGTIMEVIAVDFVQVKSHGRNKLHNWVDRRLKDFTLYE